MKWWIPWSRLVSFNNSLSCVRWNLVNFRNFYRTLHASPCFRFHLRYSRYEALNLIKHSISIHSNLAFAKTVFIGQCFPFDAVLINSFILVVSVGLLHGLFFLPVLLGIVANKSFSAENSETCEHLNDSNIQVQKSLLT